MSRGHGGAIRVTIALLGERRVDAIVKGLTEKVEDFRPLWKSIHLILSRYHERVFRAQGAHDGYRKWAPLSKRYAKWKALHFPGRPLLVLTGNLRASLTKGSHRDAVRRSEPRFMVWGSARRVGAWSLGLLHYLGTRRMPRRKPLQAGPDLEHMLNMAVADFGRGFMRDLKKAQKEWRRMAP